MRTIFFVILVSLSSMLYAQDHSNQIHSLESKISDNENEISSLRSQVSDLEDQVSNLYLEISILGGRVRSY